MSVTVKIPTNPRRPIIVKLKPYQVADAMRHGMTRAVNSMANGDVNVSGAAHATPAERWFWHGLGVCGEVAACWSQGWYWDPTVNTFKEPDAAGGVQIRTRTNHRWDLIVRKRDAPGHKFVLVTGPEPPLFHVVGWIDGEEARQSRWLADYGGKEEAYFVPQEFLRPMSEIVVDRRPKIFDQEPADGVDRSLFSKQG